MKLIFSSPSLDDLIRLLKAWRFWSVGALIGGLLGAAAFYLVPPPYRAHAVVLVDFNLEQAWPQETDRQQFYYLERETRKLVEIAFSDEVLRGIPRSHAGITIEDLQSGKLILSQPAEGGWNFYAEDYERERAASLATAWALEFAKVAQEQRDSGGLNEFIETDVVRHASLPVDRSRSVSLYIFAGAVILLAVGSIFVLFFYKPDRFSDTLTRQDTSDAQG